MCSISVTSSSERTVSRVVGVGWSQVGLGRDEYLTFDPYLLLPGRGCVSSPVCVWTRAVAGWGHDCVGGLTGVCISGRPPRSGEGAVGDGVDVDSAHV